MREKRAADEMREINIQSPFTKYAEGSVVMSFGDTKVLCTATVEEKVPPFVKERGDDSGWVTAEYNMLPRSTQQRVNRERTKVGGRTQEIQRLIGRSLRSVVDLKELGPRTIILDCDVLQADGGTRTAAISGAFIAMAQAMKTLKEKKIINKIPVNSYLAAVSVGIIKNAAVLDLNYDEDSKAEVDMNVVMTEEEKYIEIQGTAEADPFSKEELQKLLDLAKKGIKSIIKVQRTIIDLF